VGLVRRARQERPDLHDPVQSSAFNSACFTARGDAYGWLQGTSMSTPNAVGVAALVLSARPQLVGRPAALVRRLTDTASAPVNFMGPSDPLNAAPSLNGVACATGFCHLDQSDPIGLCRCVRRRPGRRGSRGRLIA
jgi:hypothetical protein